MPTKLKPCPFCGSKRVCMYDFGAAFGGWCERQSCQAQGPLVPYNDVGNRRVNGERLKAKAAALWNARHDSAAPATRRAGT